jgi:hypothetical protein
MAWSKAWNDIRKERAVDFEAFEAPCMECGLMIVIHKPHGRFCSNTCRSAWWRRDHPVVKHIAPEFA